MQREAEGDLLEHGALANLAVGVLEKRRAVGGDGARGHVARVEPRDAHGAGRGAQKAVEQLGQGRLSGAVLADDAHELAREDAHLQVVHGGAAVGITEVHVVELDHGLGVDAARTGGGQVAGAGGGGGGSLALPGALLDEAGDELLGLRHVEAGAATGGDHAVLDQAVCHSCHAGAVDAHLAQLVGVREHLVRLSVEG